ncbi:unnamed protein product [Calicophoron daubneyi]|uniref:protein-serine/threonine phosphatase n=1 Tax=Calicophoron daubneyi TaxID=300641 RepID=A0AAV2TSF8_CALDB
MGAYMSKPSTEKLSSHGLNKWLSYGVSSMQGWRTQQEDAHTCEPEFDKMRDASLFAVYDGHGGSEVARYCAAYLPEFLRKLPAYSDVDPTAALKQLFLDFDASLTTPETRAVLQSLADSEKEDKDSDAPVEVIPENEDDGDESDSEITALRAEANEPLESVLERYGGEGALPSSIKDLLEYRRRMKVGESSKTPLSSAKPAVETESCSGGSSSALSTAEGSSTAKDSASEGEVKDLPTEHENNLSLRCDQVAVHLSLINSIRKSKPKTGVSTYNPNSRRFGCWSSFLAWPCSNSMRSLFFYKETEGSTLKTTEAQEEDEDDSEDETVEIDEEEIEEAEENSEDEDSDEDDDEDEDEDEDDDDDSEIHLGLPIVTGDQDDSEPGVDSGTTACVALILPVNGAMRLYVANAGDSRAVLCRGGAAIDLSVDHKPEDDDERSRITAAGGTVTRDGRVNGGLNLSRALGDHSYKQAKGLPLSEQMITPSPDISQYDLIPGTDDFVVLACDGIWNSMTSDEVVSFVYDRLHPAVKAQPASNGVAADETGDKAASDESAREAEAARLCKICEELFDHCLAPNTEGDGTGCDNMTCIIIRFDNLAAYTSTPPLQPKVSGPVETKLESPLPDSRKRTVDDVADHDAVSTNGAKANNLDSDKCEANNPKRPKGEQESTNLEHSATVANGNVT